MFSTADSSTTQAGSAWLSRPPAELTAHIVEAFHEPLRQELPRLEELVRRLEGHGGDHRRALLVLAREFAGFRAELLDCVTREESELFGLIGRSTLAPQSDDRERFEHLRAAFEVAHRDQSQTLRLIARITDEYRAPANASASVRGLYRELNDLERLMHLHVHLEDHILFPHVSVLLDTRSERS